MAYRAKVVSIGYCDVALGIGDDYTDKVYVDYTGSYESAALAALAAIAEARSISSCPEIFSTTIVDIERR